MNLKQTATLVGVGGALVAWLAGAATSNHPAVAPAAVQRKAIDQRGAALAREVERLHERLRPEATPTRPARNLFTFHAAPRPAPRSVGALPPPIVETRPPAVIQPPLKLEGIAEDPGPDGPKRTAWIAGDGKLFTVREGDTLLQRYKVTKISTDVVELTDDNDGSTRRLALR